VRLLLGLDDWKTASGESAGRSWLIHQWLRGFSPEMKSATA